MTARDIPSPSDDSTYGNDEIKTLSSHFSLDEDRTVVEWNQVKCSLTTPEMARMSTVSTMEWIAGNLMQSHQNLSKVATVGLLIPTSTADCERGFSTLKRVKTKHRASLGMKVLNALLTISMQGPELCEFDFNTAVRKWHEKKDRRSNL